MESAETSDGGGDLVIELVVNEAATATEMAEEITPLLTEEEKPKITIFSVSYPRRRPKDQTIKMAEAEISLFSQFILWTWNGSKYSGLLCMALSATIYSIMEILSNTFSVQSIPLFEIVFSRSTIILILSFLWLRRIGQPIFGPAHVRTLLASRAIMGYLSLLAFVYSIQSLHLSQAILLNFTTPVMASIMARFILQEKIKIADIGGLACSIFGLLLIFRPMRTEEGLSKTGEPGKTYVDKGIHTIYAVSVGLFSSVTGGISYCLIRSGAKASDQPVVTVFSFGMLATPAAAVCMFALQDFVLPEFDSFLLMALLGILAFFAEILMARGLQLEKTCKVANIQYIEVFLSQIWGMGLSSVAPSFGRIFGCLFILISVCATVYFGPEKDME